MAKITGVEAMNGISKRYLYAYTRKEEPLLGVRSDLHRSDTLKGSSAIRIQELFDAVKQYLSESFDGLEFSLDLTETRDNLLALQDTEPADLHDVGPDVGEQTIPRTLMPLRFILPSQINK